MASRSKILLLSMIFSLFAFPAFADVTAKKEKFIEFLLPLIKEAKGELGIEYAKIPNSLVIAQAAVETGWGDRYPPGNLFGITIKGKPKKFHSVKEGTKYYLVNLLSHEAYEDFQEKLDAGETNSSELVSHIGKYSEDENYLLKVKSIIRREKLHLYDAWGKDCYGNIGGEKPPFNL